MRPQSSAVFAWNSELSLLAAGSAQGLAGGEETDFVLLRIICEHLISARLFLSIKIFKYSLIIFASFF
jgi:hypothetical protein